MLCYAMPCYTIRYYTILYLTLLYYTAVYDYYTININSRLKGAVDRELGGKYIGKELNFRFLTFLQKNLFYNAFFEDPSCTKCSK